MSSKVFVRGVDSRNKNTPPIATPTTASSTVYGRCSRSAAGWITLARTRNPAMTKVMLATVLNCRFLYARRWKCSATILVLPASIVSLSAKLCHFPVRGRGSRPAPSGHAIRIRHPPSHPEMTVQDVGALAQFAGWAGEDGTALDKDDAAVGERLERHVVLVED